MAISNTWNVSGSGEILLPTLTWKETQEVPPRKDRSTQEWTRLCDIPLDIVRSIFEKAMEDVPVPAHLALVSRQVQRWTEPLIYRHLVFRDSKRFSHFYRTFRNRRYSSTKSTAFFAEHVQTLHLLSRASPRMEQVTAIGRALKSLKSAAGWDNSWGRFILGFLVFDCGSLQGARVAHANDDWWYSKRGEKELWRDEAEKRRRAGLEDNLLRAWVGQDTGEIVQDGILPKALFRDNLKEYDKEDPFTYKDLRRISTSTYALREFRIDLTHRIFRDITHLDIYYHRHFNWSTLATMKNLTHLAVDLLTHVDLPVTELKYFIEELTKSCQALPRLKVIIFACINWLCRDFDLLDDESESIAPLGFLAEGWDTSRPLIATTTDEHHLHYFTQLCLGMHDPRAVLGVVSGCMPSSHLMKDYVIDFTWPKNSYDWDFTIPAEEHRESWDVAEDIITKRVQDRKERRRMAGVHDPSLRVDGEFGFGEAVQGRWNEFHSKSG